MTFSEKQHEELIIAVKAAVKEEVNGKILALDKKFSEYIDNDNKWKAGNDTKWKNAQPGLTNMNNLTGFWKVAIAAALGIVAIGAAFATLKNLFTK